MTTDRGNNALTHESRHIPVIYPTNSDGSVNYRVWPIVLDVPECSNVLLVNYTNALCWLSIEDNPPIGHSNAILWQYDNNNPLLTAIKLERFRGTIRVMVLYEIMESIGSNPAGDATPMYISYMRTELE